MALHTLVTASGATLGAVTYGQPSPAGGSVGTGQLSPADLAAISQSIVGDGFTAGSTALPTGRAKGILATGSTHSNTTLDTLVATGGGPLAAIQVGMLVLGVGIVPGTFVAAITSGTAVVLSQAATATATGVRLIFVPLGSAVDNDANFNGFLSIPGRGIVKVLPGDVIAVDNTGWPILVSAASIGYAGSLWTFT
jgi:hypothetical protein